MQGKYLITTDNWFFGPDGFQYRAVWGEVKIVEDSILGIKTNARSSNWYAKVGTEQNHVIVAGCQIHYAVKTDTKPKQIQSEINITDGVVSLHTPGHGEFFVHLNPSYSCAYMYNDEEVRFYSKRADYKTPEEQIEKQTSTANMLKILTDVTVFNFGILEHLSNSFDKLTGAKHDK